MQVCLQTQRLTLRPSTLLDENDVERLAGDIRVARTTSAIPHPYPHGAAAIWIATHPIEFDSGKRVVFAITDTATGELLGAIDLLDMSHQHARCELGYWVAHSHWSDGVCTEAARALIDYAQTNFKVTRVVARCLASNVGSRRVMEKAGLVLEGRLLSHVSHDGGFEDMLLYGLVLPGRQATPREIGQADQVRQAGQVSRIGELPIATTPATLPDKLPAMRTLPTSRCTLEPQLTVHASDMFAVLSDPAIYEFENEPPSSLAWLQERFTKLESRLSKDGCEHWLNWVVRLPSGELAGYVQATVESSGIATIAYEFASRHWRQGLGSCAVAAMMDELALSYGAQTFLAVLKARNYRSLALLKHLGFNPATPAMQTHAGPEADEVVMCRHR